MRRLTLQPLLTLIRGTYRPTDEQFAIYVVPWPKGQALGPGQCDDAQIATFVDALDTWAAKLAPGNVPVFEVPAAYELHIMDGAARVLMGLKQVAVKFFRLSNPFGRVRVSALPALLTLAAILNDAKASFELLQQPNQEVQQSKPGVVGKYYELWRGSTSLVTQFHTIQTTARENTIATFDAAKWGSSAVRGGRGQRRRGHDERLVLADDPRAHEHGACQTRASH